MIKKSLLFGMLVLSSCATPGYLHEIHDTRMDNDLRKSYIRVFSYSQDGQRILKDLKEKAYSNPGNYKHDTLMLSEGVKDVYNYILEASNDDFIMDLHQYEKKTNTDKEGYHDRSINFIQTIN